VSTTDTALHNAVHAAATWLQRMEAAETDHVVAYVHPKASIGIWREGWPHVKTAGVISDAEAEVLEALAPAIQHALDRLQERPRQAVGWMLANGWTLRALISPVTASMRIEATHVADRVEIATAYLDEPGARH